MKRGKSSGMRVREPAIRKTSIPQVRANGITGLRLLAGLAVLLLTLLAFSNSFDAGFVLDNKGLILNDPRLREATAANLKLILQHTYWWPTGEGGVYRPLTTLTYLINYAILGNRDQPFGYHLVNFLLHGCNTLLVFALALRFTRRFWPCVAIAALWAVHPIQTEAVTSIVGRADLLAATGLFGGFLAYLRATETAGGKRWAWLAAIALFAGIGIFSKENAVVLPGVIVLYELIFRHDRRPGFPQLAGLTATLIPIALWFYQRSLVLAASLPKEVPVTDNPILGAGFWAGRWTAVKVLAEYILLMIWPARLSSDYSWSQIRIAHGGVGDWFSLLVVMALVPAMVLLYRRNRGVFFLSCLSIAWLAPAANLIFPIGTIMAERFLYIPLLGFIACFVLGIYKAAEGTNYAPAVLCLVLAALATRTWVRNADWKDDLTMATASVQTSPNSYKTHDLLANVLFASDPAHANIDRVIEESRKSLAILDPLPDNRNMPDPYQLAGECYLILHEYPKAIRALQRFLAIETAEFAEFRHALKPGGRSAESAEHITASRQADAYTLLSMAYLRSGDLQNAAQSAGHARSLNSPSSQLYRQLSEIDVTSGNFDAAAEILIEGAFVMGDGNLRQKLLELYQTRTGSCALVAGPRGPALNPACPLVHQHICAAAAPTVAILVANGQREQAEARRTMFATEFGCKP